MAACVDGSAIINDNTVNPGVTAEQENGISLTIFIDKKVSKKFVD
jgi:hypothetical protein